MGLCIGAGLGGEKGVGLCIGAGLGGEKGWGGWVVRRGGAVYRGGAGW